MNTTTFPGAQAATYLPEGMPAPEVRDPLLAPYFAALAQGKLQVQRCRQCQGWQFGPEWICHRCHSFDLGWEDVQPRGRIYSWERAWHPVHPSLKQHGAYIAVLVELPQAGNVRLLGNLVGDPHQEVVIGSEVEGVFEHHAGAAMPYTLLQWKRVGAANPGQ